MVTCPRTTERKRSGTRKKRAPKEEFDSFAFAIELGRTIPDEELRRMPSDGAKNSDHYLDGSPKQK